LEEEQQMATKGEPPKPEPPASPPAPGIPINVPNVSPNTKLADLTVEQFIQVLLQIGTFRVTPDQKAIQTIIDQIRTALSTPGTTGAVNDLIQKNQAAILDKMPDLIKQALNK
jgi:hypothetical protein